VPSPTNITAPVPAGASGVVMDGQLPVANATIQLYTVGEMGDGTVATNLLTKTVTTNATGNFSIQGLYSCTNASEVYLIAMGGDPLVGVTNANLAMMTAIGPCASLNAETPVVVNELTTVAAVNALAPFMMSYSGVGSASNDVASLDAAFTLAGEMVNPATGTSPGLNVPSGENIPTAAIDTVGNIVAPCIASAGEIGGASSFCGTLFGLTTPFGAAAPTNTIAALLYLAKNPGLNTGALYQLISADAPFQPQLSGPPSNLSISVTPLTVTAPLELSPTSINYPATPLGATSQVQAATLTNPGTASLPISSIVVAGTDPASFVQTNNCPSTLPGGGFCTIQIALVPQSSVTVTGTLQINAGQLSIALSGSVNSPAWPTALLAANPSLYLNFNDATTSFLDQVSALTFVSGGGTVMPQQPGFDTTEPSNTSAGFAWNAYNKAPSNTLGDIEWDVPWTMLVQLDRLNWNRTGTLVLASKGDLSSNTWWELTLGMQWGGYSELCFTRSSAGAQDGTCTGYFDAMPNGFNYDIVVEDNGSGEVGAQGSGVSSALSIWINGLNSPFIPVVPFSNSYSSGFGYVSVAVSGGAGYSNSTAFTSTGGGPNCNVSGFMAAQAGVPYNGNWTPTGSNNYGCTSAPDILLTSPTGTGAVITATLGSSTMNSVTSPLMVPGYVSAGQYYGVAGAASAQNPTYIDEFAIFPGNLSETQVSNIFSQTKFYQGLLRPLQTPVPVLIFDDDGCGDPDNEFALQLSIALHLQGALRFSGAVSEDGSVNCEALWRQILDQAGLSNVPMSVPSSFSTNSGTTESVSNITAYNPSTPLSNAAWGPSTSMYRTIFTNYSTTPIDIVLGGPFTAMAEFMASPADSISPLTGLQLMAQNAANGGAIYAQGLGCGASSPPASTPCSGSVAGDNSLVDPVSGRYVVANNGATPIYWMGGTPQSAGPGEFSTRTGNDPMLLFLRTVGTDVRQCYDCLAVAAAVSSYFSGGVQIGFNGGTGYATSTLFTFTGGGANCQGSGYMTASGGVPNGIEFQWGANAAGSYPGIGWGCTSAPTVKLVGATGQGVNLTAYPTSVCGTYTITGDSGSINSGTCSKQYFEPYSVYSSQSPTSGAPLSWFINSLVDPTP
jgi:hypothetical protein